MTRALCPAKLERKFCSHFEGIVAGAVQLTRGSPFGVEGPSWGGRHALCACPASLPTH